MKREDIGSEMLFIIDCELRWDCTIWSKGLYVFTGGYTGHAFEYVVKVGSIFISYTLTEHVYFNFT